MSNPQTADQINAPQIGHLHTAPSDDSLREEIARLKAELAAAQAACAEMRAFIADARDNAGLGYHDLQVVSDFLAKQDFGKGWLSPEQAELSEAVLADTRAAIKEYRACDGSGGIYDAVRCMAAKERLAALGL